MITSDNLNGTILISDTFDISAATASIHETPYLNTIGSEYAISFTDLKDVIAFKKFSYDTLGMTSTRYLTNYYRISRDGINYSDWLILDRNISNFPTVNPKDNLFLEIKWIREGLSTIGSIRILDYSIEGILERDVVSDGSVVQLVPGASTILKAPFIYKVFSLGDTEILSNSDLTNVDIKYRYSQDSSRTWSRWEVLTKENISTNRINPIRFFQIEFQIENNSTSNISIQDINLIGDFQNISKDYFKTNLLGLRECCQSEKTGYTDANGNLVPANNSGDGSACSTDNALPTLSTQDKANLYSPYAQNNALNLLTKLSEDAQQVFGHKVIYFATDPDKHGEDSTMHEYQLYNVACSANIKVTVEGNNFPDSQITMNQFDLSLFESMQVNITKQLFKEVFGPQRRPGKEDFLYFCDVNRMYQVDHAQQFRGFNNAAVYYKLILKKYNQKANIKAGTPEIADIMSNLTKNSTIDALMGIENTQDKASIANKDQLKPLTKDPIRLEYKVTINKELIENSSTIVSKSNYDLSTANAFGDLAIKYKNLDTILRVSDNIGLQIWFNIHNYVVDDVYNLFNYYNEDNNLGWKANLSNDTITVTMNNNTYDFNLMNMVTNDTIALEEEVWYCYVLNIDQRNRNMEQYIYKRNVDFESDAATLSSTILRSVYENTQAIVPFEYVLENNECKILSSDMKITNIRLFADVLPKATHTKLLNQYIIGNDSRHLIFADNATVKIYLPSFLI